MAGSIGLEWYPDYSTAWSDAGCKNDVPLTFSPNSRPTYTTHLECCKVAFGGQSSGKCLTKRWKTTSKLLLLEDLKAWTAATKP